MVATVLPAGYRRARTRVLLAAVTTFALKLLIAATTVGTNDVLHWQDFVSGVARRGPVGIYGLSFERSLYNHPPLVGYLLAAVGWAHGHSVSVGFAVRALSSAADVGTALLVLAILARRRPLADARRAALLVAFSPILLAVSGFHGNTDPIFVLLVLAGVHLLLDRDRPLTAGAAIALAVGIKLVPVVVLPAMLALAWRAGPRTALRTAAGFLIPSALLWGPPLIRYGPAVRHDVLGYRGSGVSQWGLAQLAQWLGGAPAVTVLTGPGRFVVLLLAAGVPAVLAWRRPAAGPTPVALSLLLLLALGTAFGTQYLVWAMPVVLLRLRWAVCVNAAGGVLLIAVYLRWSDYRPLDNLASYRSFTGVEVALGLLVWALLLVAVADTLRQLRRDEGDPGRARSTDVLNCDPAVGSLQIRSGLRQIHLPDSPWSARFFRPKARIITYET